MNRLVSGCPPSVRFHIGVAFFVPVANLLPQPWAECIIAIKLMTLFRLFFWSKVKFQGGFRGGRGRTRTAAAVTHTS